MMLVYSWLLLAPALFDGCLGRSQGVVAGGQEGGTSQVSASRRSKKTLKILLHLEISRVVTKAFVHQNRH